jgi:hypothetical protein
VKLGRKIRHVTRHHASRGIKKGEAR